MQLVGFNWRKYRAYNKGRFLCKAAWWPGRKKKYVPASCIWLERCKALSPPPQEWRSASFILQGIQHWDQQGSWVSTAINFKSSKKAAAQELSRAQTFIFYSQQPSVSFHKVFLRIMVCVKRALPKMYGRPVLREREESMLCFAIVICCMAR